MTTIPMTYVSIEAMIDQPIDLVWPAVAAFGELDRWAAGVTGCKIEGAGIGAIRTVSIGDRQARERLEAIDPASHRLTYHVLEPHSMPARNVVSTIELTAMEGNRTAMVWRSQASDFDIPPEKVGERIGAFYAASIEGLKRMLAEGAAASA